MVMLRPDTEDMVMSFKSSDCGGPVSNLRQSVQVLFKTRDKELSSHTKMFMFFRLPIHVDFLFNHTLPIFGV